MENETTTTLLIALGILLIALLATIVSLVISLSRRKLLQKENEFQQMEKLKQFELFNATVQTEENEKQRIAADLHDEIAPLIAATSRNINFQITEWKKNGLNIAEIQNDMEVLSTISGRIREISHGLVPKLFSTFGLLKSIESHIKNLNKSSVREAQFVNNTTFSGKLPFTPNEQLLIFRICTELISNLNKHSDFDYLTISLEELGDKFILLFTHDGKGITNQEIYKLTGSDSGLGLKSLQSRTILLNASIDYYIEDSVSYIKLTVPTKNERKN